METSVKPTVMNRSVGLKNSIGKTCQSLLIENVEERILAHCLKRRMTESASRESESGSVTHEPCAATSLAF